MNAGLKMMLVNKASEPKMEQAGGNSMNYARRGEGNTGNGARDNNRIESPRMEYGNRMAYDGGNRMEYADGRDNRTGNDRARSEYARSEYDNPEIDDEYAGFEYAESKYLGRKRKPRYKNGRYAPRSEMDEDWDERPSMNYGSTHHKDKMKLGFSSVGDDDEVMPISQLSAEKWARGLEGADGTKGPHWSMDQVKQVMAQHGVSEDPWEFFAAINAMYSDYSAVLKKHGVGDKLVVYVDLAKAFIDDPDAQPDKLARYFQYIVKH